MVVFTEEPRWDWPEGQLTGGRRKRRPRLAQDNPRPVSLRSLAESLPRHKVSWREGTKGKLAAKFTWVRVWPGQDWARGGCAGAEPIWLLIEERADGQIQYAFSNLPLAGGAGLPADGRFPVFGTGRMWQYWPTARPLRIEYPGATHHLMSRGNQ